MENFKEKKFGEWTKEKNKKEQEAIDEILMIRRNGANE
jgi:flagellar biosynthesis chaperone FliJ